MEYVYTYTHMLPHRSHATEKREKWINAYVVDLGLRQIECADSAIVRRFNHFVLRSSSLLHQPRNVVGGNSSAQAVLRTGE